MRDGAIVFGGGIFESDYPTTSGALCETYNGDEDGFLSVLSPDGHEMVASTYIGGPLYDVIFDIQVDSGGGIILAGGTAGVGAGAGSGFPVTPNSYDSEENGELDAYLAKIDSDLAAIEWGTFLGGSGDDGAFRICLDNDDNPVVVGSTMSTDFPILEYSYACSTVGNIDGFIAKMKS